jgi:hypothetical protein
MTIYVERVGLFAPGLEGWQSSRAVLAGEAEYQPQPLPKYKPQLLPANERRRASAVVRLAFGACEDAIGDRLQEASQLAAVFASSGGDYTINDQICRAILSEQKAVSPTQFHNSVHNAAAGYWSIASKSQATSISLSACDYSVATGLMEAQSLLLIEQVPLLLVCCDTSVVAPMHAKRPVAQSFAAALWLSPQPTSHSMAGLDMQMTAASDRLDTVGNSELESLRLDNPAARILPLLALLAKPATASVQLQLAGSQSLQLAVTPC